MCCKQNMQLHVAAEGNPAVVLLRYLRSLVKEDVVDSILRWSSKFNTVF